MLRPARSWRRKNARGPSVVATLPPVFFDRSAVVWTRWAEGVENVHVGPAVVKAAFFATTSQVWSPPSMARARTARGSATVWNNSPSRYRS
jgi:hypothetical protein